MRPPKIDESTEEERRQFIRNTFKCIADCDMCGLCIISESITRLQVNMRYRESEL